MLSGICAWILRRFGWTLVLDFPDVDKYVIIAAPHTSNWDFFWGILAVWVLRLEVSWIGKHTIFRWPFGGFFRWLGGIPVDRGKNRDVICTIAALFEDSEKLVIALAPEGTRSKTDHWKTGFYHIARAAGVPIAMAYFDFPNKQIGVGGTFYTSDDSEHDLETIRAFYRHRRGKNPENESLIRFRS